MGVILRSQDATTYVPSSERSMFGVRKAPTGCNFVHNDEIWKDHVQRELQTSRKWPDTWGFLAVHYKVICPPITREDTVFIHQHAQRPAQQKPSKGQPCRKQPASSPLSLNTAAAAAACRLPTTSCKLPPIIVPQHPTTHTQSQSVDATKDGCEREEEEEEEEGPRLRRMSYPKTTAGEVGWLCADFKKLEKFGRHARGQNGIRKLLNWPREAIY